MSMGTSVKGVRNLDGEFAKMSRIKEACDEAGVEYPAAVRQYFQHPGESLEYLRQQMEEMSLGAALTERSDDSRMIYEVDLSKLPPEVKVIRFVNSW